LYSLPSKIRRSQEVKEDDMGRTYSMYVEKRNSYMIFVVKPEGIRSLGRPRRRWEDNTKIDLRYDGVVWTGLIGFRIRISGEIS
jgi:hypothetical protein